MYCGLDFGTSNCSIGSIENGAATLYKVDGENVLMPSCVFAMRKAINAKRINEAEVQKLTDNFIKQQTAQKNKFPETKLLSPQEIEKLVRNRLERDANAEALRKYKEQGISSFNETTQIVVGTEAINQHALYPSDGIFSKSPKTFLASDISSYHLSSFQRIVTSMLSHIKNKAEIQSQKQFDSVVLGRPVNYSEVATEKGNNRAIQIMQSAAKAAGFKNIEFEFEPIAASIDFESTLTKEACVLVVDIGGGTTDVTMTNLSPAHQAIADRKHLILSSVGTRVGGNDIDIIFSLYKICQHLGKESLGQNNAIINKGSPVNLEVYWNATHINNVQAIEAFRSQQTRDYIKSQLSQSNNSWKTKLSRLLRLQEGDFAFRFNRSSELSKILLSEKTSINLPLKYLDPELIITLTRNDLEDAMGRIAAKIQSLIRECIKTAGKNPDYVYITGGSAKSPSLMKLILDNELLSKTVSGDAFGSVTQGLVLSARNKFS